MNVEAKDDYGLVAEEFIPSDFEPLALPEFLNGPRRILFGIDPDREFQNYRTRQLLGILHATALQDYVFLLDRRITYDVKDSSLFAEDAFRPIVTQISGPTASPTVLGQAASLDKIGRFSNIYLVEILGSSVAVTRQTKPAKRFTYDLALQNGLSGSIPLDGSGHSFLSPTNDPSVSWLIEIKNRPAQALGVLAAALKALGEPQRIGLFGAAPVEPFLTFRNLWDDHPDLPWELGGFLLAVIYRTEEIRRRNADA